MHYRHLERQKIEALAFNKGNFEAIAFDKERLEQSLKLELEIR